MDKNKKFKLFLGLLLAIFAVGYGSVIVVLFLPVSLEFKLSYALIAIVVVFILSVLLRPKVYILSIASHFSKMKENQNPMIHTAFDIASESFEKHLYHKGYQSFGIFDNVSSFYQISYGEDIIRKRGILEIINVIKDDDLGFHDGIITSLVHDIKNHIGSQKKKYLHYLIINLKKTSHLSNEQIDQADEVVFEKHRNHHVAIINGFLDTTNQKLYALANDYHMPSIV
ncbi:MAG: hypothetical protein EOM23_09335, partial [Candidatus Moranbacteria bacterium]|nr:hypothetical protein [Candidatus Moranbacteria bacterium]